MNLNNQVGTNNLIPAYRKSAHQVLLCQTNSLVILRQPSLFLASMDMRLATQVNNFQAKYKSGATTVLSSFTREYLQILAKGQNYAQLIIALSGLGTPALKSDFTLLLDEFIKLAGEIEIDFKGLQAEQEIVSIQLLNELKAYEMTLDSVIRLASARVQTLNANINEMSKASKACIDKIVSSAFEVGKGVTSITVGIIGQVAGNLPAKKGATAVADKTPLEVPDVSFVIEGIQQISGGIAESSEAAKEFQRLNNQLAAAYQELAKADGIVAAAKVIQAQNEALSTSLRQALPEINGLRQEWQKVKEGYTKLNAANVETFVQNIPLLKKEWELLLKQTQAIKDSFANG
jgi:hypothetical protein